MTRFQQDDGHIAALLDLMLATKSATDARAQAYQTLDWLMARDGVVAGGIWLVQSNDLVCVARRNIDPDEISPAIQQAIAVSAPSPQTLVYQQDLYLTLLPLGMKDDLGGALVAITQAPPDPGELLLLRAVAAHLAATITLPQPVPRPRTEESDRIWEEFLAHAAHEI